MNLAVLFIVFNRPELTGKSFQAICAARPERLYIAADGPRVGNASDLVRCAQVREVVSAVDWPCKVQTLFRKKNLGCKIGCSSAITWFFQHEAEGVILEDDCLAHPDFFTYCAELLEYYRERPEIMLIAGSNFNYGKKWGTASYYFSAFSHIWGWASWARAWKVYDINMSGLEKYCTQRLPDKLKHLEAVRFFSRKFLYVAQGLDSAWDYQQQYTIWRSNGLCVAPNVNLVENIGYGADSVHAGIYNLNAMREVAPIGQIIHPPVIARNWDADLFECERRVNEEGQFGLFLIREAADRFNSGDCAAALTLARMIRAFYGPSPDILQVELLASLGQKDTAGARSAFDLLTKIQPDNELLPAIEQMLNKK